MREQSWSVLHNVGRETLQEQRVRWVSFEYTEFSMHLLDAGVVNEAGIGAGASNDELGPEQLGRHIHLVVVYESCCGLQRGREGDRLRREGRGRARGKNTGCGGGI